MIDYRFQNLRRDAKVSQTFMENICGDMMRIEHQSQSVLTPETETQAQAQGHSHQRRTWYKRRRRRRFWACVGVCDCVTSIHNRKLVKQAQTQRKCPFLASASSYINTCFYCSCICVYACVCVASGNTSLGVKGLTHVRPGLSAPAYRTHKVGTELTASGVFH